MEDGDYINCPFTKDEYENFIDALLDAERIPLREFEITIRDGVRAGLHKYFEACLPVEVIAERGRDALAYGPMRPVGLTDPRTGKRPYAVVQLRQDNLIASLYNLVGFQTNLTYKSQSRVFRLIPGLETAEFIRYGQMHRNTFINSPNLLHPSLQSRFRSDLFFAGQITGVEGYLGNIATGLLSGLNVSRFAEGKDLIVLPESTMLGALCSYISSSDPARFQPMKANFGIFPPLDDGVRRNRRDRARAYADRSSRMLSEYLITHPL
jgi:methylenetetrahydrofolate--tRNA-(uracil-5-)-methyltransferase